MICLRKIFICAPNKYERHTKKLCEVLESHGFKVYYAARDTAQDAVAKEIFRCNSEMIMNCDVFLGYFVNDGHYGIDFAVEVGKASARGIPVIAFIDVSFRNARAFEERLDNDIMLKHSFTDFVHDISGLLDRLNEN